MTVRELINYLEEFPGDMSVYRLGEYSPELGDYTTQEVEQIYEFHGSVVIS